MNVHAKFLRSEELKRVAVPVMQRELERYGFHSLDIREDETSDGQPVIRLVATVDHPVPAKHFLKTLDETLKALRLEGEDRLVFLMIPAVQAEEINTGEEDIG